MHMLMVAPAAVQDIKEMYTPPKPKCLVEAKQFEETNQVEVRVRVCASHCCMHMLHAYVPRARSVQWSEDVVKADPFISRSRDQFSVPPWFRKQWHVSSSLSEVV